MRRLSILLLTALVLTGTAAVADEPAPKPDKDKDKKKDTEATGDEVITFTTEDLERKYGPSAKTPPKPAGAFDRKALTPLEQMQAAQQANRDKAVRREQLRKDVQASQARIKELEGRVVRLRNPLLGAAKPEEGEKASWDRADQAGRVKIAQDTLAAERAKLQQTLKELGELR